MRTILLMDEYFDRIPVGVLDVTNMERHRFLFVPVHECKKCGALVRDESRDTHVADHEATLKLVHDLHDAAHHHLT